LNDCGLAFVGMLKSSCFIIELDEFVLALYLDGDGLGLVGFASDLSGKGVGVLGRLWGRICSKGARTGEGWAANEKPGK